MTTKKPPAAKKRTTVKKQEYTVIFEEVEKFEDLGPRMHELLVDLAQGDENLSSRSRSQNNQLVGF